MRKKYKILIIFIVIEFLCVSILGSKNILVENWAINAVGTLMFFSPMLYLLFSISNDSVFSERKRFIAKTFFYFIIICYIIGGVVTYFE